MALFRRRPDRIRGIAGSLDGKTVLVVDGTGGAGPGAVRVAAEAGASTVLAGPDHVAIDLQLRSLAHTPEQTVAVVTSADTDLEYSRLLGATERFPDVIVVNPFPLSLETHLQDPHPSAGHLSPLGAVRLARLATTGMLDRGLTGSVVFLSQIERSGPSAGAAAYMHSEMRQLAGQVAPSGIRVNAIAAGQVAINRRGNVISSRVAPLGHSSLHPVEIGKAVWFLINDDLSGGITGTVLTVDRGASLSRPEW